MKGRNYRQPKGQPYTREEYIRGAPPPKIAKFVMGDTRGNYEYRVALICEESVQVRHNSLEAARVAVNKVFLDRLGETGYRIHLRVYPHIVLRENRMIATAGADRLQEGMRRAFGKPIGRAARLKPNQPIIDVYVNENGLEFAKEAMRVGSTKLPTRARVEITKIIAA